VVVLSNLFLIPIITYLSLLSLFLSLTPLMAPLLLRSSTENSKRAVWFTWGIASLGTLLGNIDRITPILTMFYLMMYGGINLCCFLLAWVDSPGFRPQ
jgi:potassium/chloride transporter 4/5/6